MSRLQKTPSRVFDEVLTEDASSWGYLKFDGATVPVGFSDVGLEPQCTAVGDIIAIGINELVVGLDRSRATAAFRYRMPTIFHEFLTADDRGLVVRDEIGFVWISLDGMELWTYCVGDVIEDFSISGRSISGKTFEGRSFAAELPAEFQA